MEEKKQFNLPLIEIVAVDSDDVIATSGTQEFDMDGIWDKDYDNWYNN